MRVAFVVLLFSLTILAVAVALLLYFGKPNEAKYVNKSEEQAVFLTNGQVYFGHINSVNNDFLDLQNIFYLSSNNASSSTSSTTTSNNFTLIKLGCELHGPEDQMVINNAQVSFWENLTTGGKVTKAIQQWEQQNPNGQNCSNSSSSTSTQQSSTNNSTTAATTPTNSTTNTGTSSTNSSTSTDTKQ